jgi:hypothetical protein
LGQAHGLGGVEMNIAPFALIFETDQDNPHVALIGFKDQ